MGTVGETEILKDAVTTTKIKDANVTTAKIADANITTAKLANNAVTEAKLADTAVRVINLGSGEAVTIKDEDGFPLFEVDNDTKKVKARGNIERF